MKKVLKLFKHTLTNIPPEHLNCKNHYNTFFQAPAFNINVHTINSGVKHLVCRQVHGTTRYVVGTRSSDTYIAE